MWTTEKDKLIAFFKDRDDISSFKKIQVDLEDIITKGIYVDDDEFITQLIHYAKDLVLLTPYEYGMLIYILSFPPCQRLGIIHQPSVPHEYIMVYLVHGKGST